MQPPEIEMLHVSDAGLIMYVQEYLQEEGLIRSMGWKSRGHDLDQIHSNIMTKFVIEQLLCNHHACIWFLLHIFYNSTHLIEHLLCNHHAGIGFLLHVLHNHLLCNHHACIGAYFCVTNIVLLV